MIREGRLADLPNNRLLMLIRDQELRTNCGIASLSERGGQIRRDIERLAHMDDGNDFTNLRIEGFAQPVQVVVSPTQTRIQAVVPRDVRTAALESRLEAMRIATREGADPIHAMNIGLEALDGTSDQLLQLVEELAERLL